MINLLNRFRRMLRTRSRHGDSPGISTEIQYHNCASRSCEKPSGDITWILCESWQSWFYIVCVGITPEDAPNINFVCGVCDEQLSRARKRHCRECDQFVTVRNNGKLYSHCPINNRCSMSGRSATPNSATATFDFCNFDRDNFIEFWKVCNCSTLKLIPKAARVAFAMTLTERLNQVLETPENKETWVRLLVHPVFCLQKTHRKGKAGKMRLSSVVQQQIAAFNRGEYTLPVSTKSPFLPPKNENGKLILEKLDEGDIRGAVGLAASDDTFTQPSEETLHNFHSKHPASPENRRAAPATEVMQLQVSQREIRSAIFSFPSGSAAGPSGLRLQHLKDAVSSSANEAGNQLLAPVTAFCNLFLRGDLPEFIKPVLSSATLISLTKKCGGIHPIAIGETLRRLTAKCVSRRMLRKFQSFLEPLQLGAGSQNGCEAASHAAREYIASDCAVKAFVKIDFFNAFNNVRRDPMFECKAEHAPEILQFV